MGVGHGVGVGFLVRHHVHVHHLLLHVHVVHHHVGHGLSRVGCGRGRGLMNRGSGLRLHHVVGYEFGVMPHVLDEGMVLVMKSIVLLGRSQGGQENHQFEL